LLPLLCAITHTLTPKSASISTPRATCPRALQNWVTKPLSVHGRCRRLSRSTRRHLAARSPHPSSRCTSICCPASSHSLITPLPSTSVPTPRNPTTLPWSLNAWPTASPSEHSQPTQIAKLSQLAKRRLTNKKLQEACKRWRTVYRDERAKLRHGYSFKITGALHVH
jgi:hypothetical protein